MEEPKKRRRGRPRKVQQPATMTLGEYVGHNEYLERKAKRNEKKKPAYRIDFPRDHENNILAHAWIGTIHNPCKWLAEYVNQEGITPHKNPWSLSPVEQQRAIARIFCPTRDLEQFGCGVNFEQDPKTMFTSCEVVLYTPGLLNWWAAKLRYYRGGHFYAANGSVDDLHRQLATGIQGRIVVLPVLYRGLPIGDNMEWAVPT